MPASKRFNPLLKQKFTLRGTEETEDFPTKSELCFQQLAKAYGVPSVQLFRLDEDLDATLQRVLYCQEPALLHARIDSHCALTPQVARDETLDVM